LDRERQIRNAVILYQDYRSPPHVELERTVVSYATQQPDFSRENGDRVVVFQDKNSAGQIRICLAVIDGMGGYDDPARAAQLLGESIVRGVLDHQPFEQIQKNAHEQMAAKSSRMGAVYAAALIENAYLKTYHAGDARMIVIREGKVIAATSDQGRLHSITNAVTNKEPGQTIQEIDMQLTSGDIFALFSDGVTNNLHPSILYKTLRYSSLWKSEVISFTNEVNVNIAALTEGKTPEEIVNILGSRAQKRMHTEGSESDDMTMIVAQLK
jgi:serine/threonine protein phosphatase PrpC